MSAADEAIARLAERQHGVVSRSQALELGLSPAQIAGRLDRGELERPVPGALRLPGSPWTFPQRVMTGVLAAGRGAVASHRSAGAFLGFPESPGGWRSPSPPPGRCTWRG